MPKAAFDKLSYTQLTPTTMTLQLADSSVRYPVGIAEDISMKIWDYFVLVDFVVLDMEFTKESPLILGWPFLSTVRAHIDIGAEVIHYNINRKEEKFEFWPRQQEDCKMICIKYGLNQQSIREVEIKPHLIFSCSQVIPKGKKGDPGKVTHKPQAKPRKIQQPKWVPKEPKKKKKLVPNPLSTENPSSSKQ
jgi:hypothetical protein